MAPEAHAATFFIETLGCQMNKLDSELVAAALQAEGLTAVPSADKADLAVLNTCSVREHAEAKALSRLGHWNHLRRKSGRPAAIAIIGCFAQRDPRHILAKAPFVDIVCGPGRIHELPELHRRLAREKHLVATDDFQALRAGRAEACPDLESLDVSRPTQVNEFQAFVRVQRGCEKFCTYCIVPYVRGPECSRPVPNILDEVKRLDAAGVKEVTLLGQAISSYRAELDGRTVGLAELLRMVHERTAIPRIRFITSYPGDFHTDVLSAMAELPRVCPYLHLPAQHGSNAMLRLMNRKYTVEQYLEIIQAGKTLVPDLSIAGDFIVGFPGETDDDHQRSLDLLRRVRYKNCFVFKYSPRPGTVAARRHHDSVSDDLKTARLRQLLDVQDAIAAEDNRQLISRTLSVLVEGRSKKSRTTGRPQLVARTVDDKIVVLDGPESLVGQITSVQITNATALTLFAELTATP